MYTVQDDGTALFSFIGESKGGHRIQFDFSLDLPRLTVRKLGPRLRIYATPDVEVEVGPLPRAAGPKRFTWGETTDVPYWCSVESRSAACEGYIPAAAADAIRESAVARHLPIAGSKVEVKVHPSIVQRTSPGVYQFPLDGVSVEFSKGRVTAKAKGAVVYHGLSPWQERSFVKSVAPHVKFEKSAEEAAPALLASPHPPSPPIAITPPVHAPPSPTATALVPTTLAPAAAMAYSSPTAAVDAAARWGDLDDLLERFATADEAHHVQMVRRHATGQIAYVEWAGDWLAPSARVTPGGRSWDHHRCRSCERMVLRRLGAIGDPDRPCLYCAGFPEQAIPVWYATPTARARPQTARRGRRHADSN